MCPKHLNLCFKDFQRFDKLKKGFSFRLDRQVLQIPCSTESWKVILTQDDKKDP